MTGSNETISRRTRFEDYALARLWVHDLGDRVLEVRPVAPDAPSSPFPFDAASVHVITPSTRGPTA